MSRLTQRDMKDEIKWENRFAAIEKEAEAILAAEGAHYVRGVYYVLESDASMARMVEAERRVAKRDESMDRYIVKGRVDNGEQARRDRTAHTNDELDEPTTDRSRTECAIVEMAVIEGLES